MPVQGGHDSSSKYHLLRLDATGRTLVNPASDRAVDQQYFATAAPHVQTTRWTYTVPAGKMAILERYFLYCDPTAANADGQINIMLNRSAGGNKYLDYLASLAAGETRRDATGAIVLRASDVLTLNTILGGVANKVMVAAAFLREIDL